MGTAKVRSVNERQSMIYIFKVVHIGVVCVCVFACVYGILLISNNIDYWIEFCCKIQESALITHSTNQDIRF